MIQQTEVDGVPTFIAPGDGPLRAGLTFRVGMCDETLATHGITHLVEHLALHRHGVTDYHFNGATSTTLTHFHMEGAQDDVVQFLTGVCTSLDDLPAERLDTEKAILGTEQAGRSRVATDVLPLWRYGAQGYGLPSYPEWGAADLTPEHLQSWVSRYFTRQNAVLWIVGDDVPKGLRLPLQDGVRQPLPAPTSTLPVTPAYFTGGSRVVVLDAVVPRRLPATLYAKVLHRELMRSLRQDGGYSYAIDTACEPRDATFGTVIAAADSAPGKQDATLGAFIDVLMGLKFGRVNEADLASVVKQAEQALRQAEAEGGNILAYAANELTGRPNKSTEQLLTEAHEITGEDVVAVAGEVLDSALLGVPEGLRADWAGFTAAPTHSESAVAGRRFPSRGDGGARVVIGTEGVTMDHGEGMPATVRFDSCAAQLCWPDGARQLVGTDGIVVRLEPNWFALPPDAYATIDTHLDPSRSVRLPARPPEDIPPPPTPGPSATAEAARPTGLASIVILSIVVTFLTCIGGLFTAARADDPSLGVAGWVMGGGLLGIAAMFGVALAVRIVRQRRPGSAG